jgi:hypothetical protein
VIALWIRFVDLTNLHQLAAVDVLIVVNYRDKGTYLGEKVVREKE